MNRFYGKVGYSSSIEYPSQSGIWTDQIVERYYYGDLLQVSSKWQSRDMINDELKIQNKISIVADAYAYSNFSKIKYVEWMGTLWKVDSIEVASPRLILSLGGEWNG